jgi:hypothetical protein
LPIITPPTVPHSSSSGAGTIGQLVADVTRGLSFTPSQGEKREQVSYFKYFGCGVTIINTKEDTNKKLKKCPHIYVKK